MIAADEKDGVIRSRAGDHPAEENNGLGRNREAQLGDSGQNGLRNRQGEADLINGSNMVIGFR